MGLLLMEPVKCQVNKQKGRKFYDVVVNKGLMSQMSRHVTFHVTPCHAMSRTFYGHFLSVHICWTTSSIRWKPSSNHFAPQSTQPIPPLSSGL
jgi:hypothetical protein